MTVKQVIVMRRDLKMRRGKEIAQGAHAAMAWMSHALGHRPLVALSDVQHAWLSGLFTKVCVTVSSEAELDGIVLLAQAAGIDCHVITDSGLTEFHGIHTKTCLALGPDEAEKIDKITGHLKLY